MIVPLTDAERFDWLRLTRSDGIGPLTFLGLLQRYGNAAAALDALPALIRKRGGAGRALSIASPDAVFRELEQVQRQGLFFVALNEPAYPPALRAIDSAPPVLCVRGDLSVLQKPMVAIVGSRNASGSGLLFTHRLAHGIGAAGYVIVSGLARGIDAKAHRAALATGTVAVLAGGHDHIYPSEHVDFARLIAEQGAVLSEMPLSWEPRGRDFPRRNRIVSGLSLGTVVIEAARRSGSLITARLSNEQGREVFAVPGSPLDPRAEGTNDLLRQGATLCTRPEDVIEALGPITHTALATFRPTRRLRDDPDFDQRTLFGDMDFDDVQADHPVEPSDSPDRDDATHILNLLGPAPMAIDDLVRLSALSAAQVRSILMDLELAGALERHNGTLVSKVLSDR